MPAPPCPDLTKFSLEKLIRGLNQANSLARGRLQQQVDDSKPEEWRVTRPKGMSVPFYESFLCGISANSEFGYVTLCDLQML